MTKQEIAKYIDHTLLAPDATSQQIGLLCSEAKQYGFASVCVNPYYVPLAAELLKDCDVKVCTVIGFPLGAVTTKDKAAETKLAVANGADEVDMVINIGAAKEGNYKEVGKDIAGVVRAAKSAGVKAGRQIVVKVILETCLLTDEQVVKCSLAAKKAKADFVKTSTGFANPKGIDGKTLPNGASEHHVKLMRKTVGPEMGVKASGGIRSESMLRLMLESGANRIGTSSGATIVANWNDEE